MKGDEQRMLREGLESQGKPRFQREFPRGETRASYRLYEDHLSGAMLFFNGEALYPTLVRDLAPHDYEN
jgi:hypothetical protein